MPRTKGPADIVGPRIRERRDELGLTPEGFAAQCQLSGLDISRATVSQIEAQRRCLTENELFALARVLRVTTDSLFPLVLKRRKKAR